MAVVYVTNLIINAGSDFEHIFHLQDSAINSVVDITNYTASSQLRKWAGSSSATNFTTEIIPPYAVGRIKISLTAEQTANLKPGRYVYDVLLNRSGFKSRLVEGSIIVREGVTR